MALGVLIYIAILDSVAILYALIAYINVKRWGK
jgi:hypothetical protein